MKNYFYFSKSQRRGALLFVLVLAFIIALMWLA